MANKKEAPASLLKTDDESELQKRVTSGDCYEASQLYLGHMGRLRQAGQFVESEGVGMRGVAVLVKANESALATPLALKVIESLSARTKESNTQTYEQLKGLVESFDLSNSEGVLKQKLIVSKAACKIASGSQSAIYNDTAKALHAIRASDLSKSGQLAEAARHYAVADLPEEYAQLLERWISIGYESEKDLFAVRAVLHVLSLGSHPSTADSALKLNNCLKSMKLLGGNTPLEHFLSLTLELLGHLSSFTIGKSGASCVYGTLLKSYAPALQGRDPRMAALAETVGRRHFGWVPPPSPMQGLMDMFK